MFPFHGAVPDTAMTKVKRLPLLLGVVLLAWSMTWAGSKRGFPQLDEKDLPFYLHTQEPGSDPYIYLFSTLSLISRRRDTIVFNISRARHTLTLPLIALEIYPSPDAEIQSEFFDVTIWGQLGNYFNKNIELLMLENEILKILQDLEEVNARYQDLISPKHPIISQPQRLPTLDQHNYLTYRDTTSPEPSRKDSGDAQPADDRPPNDLRGQIHRHEAQLQRATLKTNPALQRPTPEGFGKTPFADASLPSAQQARTLDSTGAGLDSLLFQLFHKMVLVIRYVMENKLESSIYFSLLILFSVFIKSLFSR